MASHSNKLLQIERLSFSYPNERSSDEVIKNISLTVEEGSFHIIAGCSGSGKTTLLRQVKPMLAPNGKRSGSIFFDGELLEHLSPKRQVTDIGYVFQNPENQIVMHRVAEELSFGLENLGTPVDKIKRRVAEMVTYFGIETWYDAEIHSLSGGQKQIINLAAIMTMNPRLLILDEPTASLDPISAEEFFQILYKLREDMGVTILLSEHRLEGVLPRASHFTLLEGGKKVAHGTPREVGVQLIHKKHPMLAVLPSPMRAFAGTGVGDRCPLTILEGRKWFRENRKPGKRDTEKNSTTVEQDVIRVKELAFRYVKKEKDVLRDFDASIKKGKITGIVGGNGSGKSTLLSLIAGVRKPLHGKITVHGGVAMLPQNPKHLFLENTVKEELGEEPDAMTMFHLEHLCERHPYDLSGGEMARLAFAKIYLLRPDIYLLDEPTRGMDAIFKEELEGIFRTLTSQEKTIVMVSHDIEFLSTVAEDVIFIFQGKSVYAGDMRAFLGDNIFYSTGASKMTRGIESGIITVQDVIDLCKNI